MSETVAKPSKFHFYRDSEIMVQKKKLKDGSYRKFFHFHIPIALYSLLDLSETDKVQVFVNYDKREILLRLKSPEKKGK